MDTTFINITICQIGARQTDIRGVMSYGRDVSPLKIWPEDSRGRREKKRNVARLSRGGSETGGE
jgi:hypothetical protein